MNFSEMCNVNSEDDNKSTDLKLIYITPVLYMFLPVPYTQRVKQDFFHFHGMSEFHTDTLKRDTHRTLLFLQ